MNKYHKTLQRMFLLVAAIATLGLVTGCHHNGPAVAASPLDDSGIATPPVAPTISVFTAEPTVIDLGGSVVLNWRTQNADSVTIEGIGSVNVNGTQTATPSSSTTFRITAKNSIGTADANVRVTVQVPTAPNVKGVTDIDMTSDAEFTNNVKDAFFDYDSADLRPDAQSVVQKDATYLAAHPAMKVVIGGYCDERGSAEYNIALGQSRANSAKTALVNAGISPNRIRIISYGKEKQFCSDETEACWQQNRRAQFSLDR